MNIQSSYVELALRAPSTVARRVMQRVSAMRRDRDQRAAESYLREHGVLELLTAGDQSEICLEHHDLCHLHREIRRRKPCVVLEFGVGFSTIVMAHAIHQNHLELPAGMRVTAHQSKLWTVDTSQRWLQNTRAKMPDYLLEHVEFRRGIARACVWGGEICHMFDELPDIVPSFIYLDGPNPADVEGNVHGLQFPKPTGPNRSVVSADILLYESTYKPGTLIVVDGRYQNVQFLRRHLKRDYRFKKSTLWNYSVFECRA